MDKKYLVIGVDGKHDYDITVVNTDKGKEYSIFNSMGTQWLSHAQGKLVLKMTDTGNGMVFDKKLGKKQDYHEVLCLHILLSVERVVDPQLKYQVIEHKTLIEV
jgi:hypothetical protein